MKKAGYVFNNKFTTILKTINFDHRWLRKFHQTKTDKNHRSDYFDGAITGEAAVKLEPGMQVKSTSPSPDNKRMIFTGTRLGVVLICHRYPNNHEVIVANSTDAVMETGMIPTGKLSTKQLQFILGCNWPVVAPNIGNWLEKMYEILNKESTTFEQTNQAAIAMTEAIRDQIVKVAIDSATQDQIASVMLQHGTPEQQLEALKTCAHRSLCVDGVDVNTSTFIERRTNG